MQANLISETAYPGRSVNREQLERIYCRYHTASKFVHGRQVLEVGCGAGIGLGYLARRAKRVVGGDRTEDLLSYAREHYRGKIELLLLDAHTLPFKDGCFDAVIAMEVMQYLPQPDTFLNECHRILKKGGDLVLCLPNKDVPGFHKSPLSIRFFSAPELFALLNQNFDAKIFGAFPISGSASWQRLRIGTTVMAGKALDLVPKGKKVKKFINRFFLRKTLLKEEIEDGMVEDFRLVPLDCDSPDSRHNVLYAIAHAR